MKNLFLMDEQRKQFPEMRSTPCEDAVKIDEMPTEDIEYSINLVNTLGPNSNKSQQGSEITARTINKDKCFNNLFLSLKTKKNHSANKKT